MKYLFIALQCIALTTNAQSADSLITKESLYKNVSFLANDSLKGRLTGSSGIGTAADYIREFFKQNQVKPLNIFPHYYDSFLIDRPMILGINVVGAVQGYGSDSSIIVSAHYDHIGKGHSPLAFGLTKKADSIYNGANDNATGTAAMMELAKYFAATKRNYYTIIFIAFSGEELGMKGSNHFAKFIDNPGMVKAVVNLEMLGRPFRKNSAFYTGAAAPKIIRGINNAIADKTGTKVFLYEDPFEKQMLYKRSDHYSFVNIIDQSFTIMASSPEDAYYHSIYDETKTIDFDFFLFAVKNITVAVEYLAN